MSNKIALLTVVHDPDSNFTGAIDSPNGDSANCLLDYLPRISSLFDLCFCEVTQETSQKLIEALQSHMLLNISSKNGMAQARRKVLSSGLESDATHFFCCDFDRLLFWVSHYPEELEQCLKYIFRYDFIVYGRTKQAIETHPQLQKITENAGNALYRHILGSFNLSFLPSFNSSSSHHSFSSQVDVLSSARSFKYVVGEYFKEYSKANGAKIDVEWPFLVQASDYFSFGYTEVKGLSYEHNFCKNQKPDLEELELRLKNLSDIQEFVKKYN